MTYNPLPLKFSRMKLSFKSVSPKFFWGVLLCLAACSGALQMPRAPEMQSSAAPSAAELKSKTTGKYRVALLVPLSGNTGKLGKSVLEAAQLALFDAGNPDIALIPIDTTSTVAGSTRAAKEAVSKKANLVLGPIFSNSVSAVTPETRTAGISLISFSNNKSAAGEGVYLMGLMPDQQIDRVVRHAASHGVRTIAAAVPDDAFGAIASGTLKMAASASRIKVAGIEVYDSAKPDLPGVAEKIARLVSNDGGNAAILFPEAGNRVADFAAALKIHGVYSRNVKFLGSYLWDEPETISNPDLEGAWFASVPLNERERFLSRFEKTFGYRPSIVASLGYDAAALAASLAESPGGADFSREAITSPSGFSGINGIFRFKKNGLSERGLAVMEIRTGGVSLADPAPSGF